MSPLPFSIAAALRLPGLDPVDLRVLMQHVLSVNHAYLIAHSERTLTSDEQGQFEACVQRRVAGEPVAYIVGRREFYGRDFGVSPAVLIPRPETELLVEEALERMRGVDVPTVLDLGTGSGCVAITLALERADARVVGVDTSADALRVAIGNARTLGASNVRFAHGHWFDPVKGERSHLVVSNPPYVANADPHLACGDLRFEPRSALASGAAGLDAIADIVASAPRHLRPGGWLLLEHGWDQGASVATLLERAGFEDRFVAHDLAGHPRVSGGRLRA